MPIGRSEHIATHGVTVERSFVSALRRLRFNIAAKSGGKRSKIMKNLGKFLGIIALIAVIGFAGCSNGSTDSGGTTDTRVALTAGPAVNAAYDDTSASVTFTGATGLTLAAADFTVTGGLSITNVAVSGETVTVTIGLTANQFNQSYTYTVGINSNSTKIKGTAAVTITQAANPSGTTDTRVALTAGSPVNVTYTATSANVTFTGATGLTLAAADFAANNGATIGSVSVSGGTVTVTVNFSANAAASAKTYTVSINTSSTKIKGSAAVTITQAANTGETIITPTTPEAMTSKSALEYFADEGIKMGWNLGNTLDAVNIPSAAVETAWGNPAATKALIDGVKAQGFDIVRIGCTWIGHIGPAPDYTISEARLKRVAEVVNWVHAAGMKAIINIHHDGNYSDPSKGTWGFLKFAEAKNSSAVDAQVKEELAKVWTQIANYFKNYGDYLIFEVMNEVHSGDWGSPYSSEDDFTRHLQWKQVALNAIRATGGNNATRFVTVPSLGGSEPGVVLAAHSKGKMLPNDPGNGTSKLIVSCHFYAPAEYTVADAASPDPSFVLRHTITSAELAAIDTEARELKETFFDNGIAVYYGEWGAPTNVRASMNTTIKNTHTDYIKRVAKAARSNGIVPIIWDDGGDFKMLERSGSSPGAPKSGLWADTLTAYKAGINEATWPTGSTPPPELTWDSGSKAGTWTWGEYNDSANSGTSTITKTDNGGGSFSFTGNVTTAYEYGFAGWSVVPDSATLPYLRAASSFSFTANGAAKTYVIIVKTTNITDYSDYQTTFTTDGTNKSVTIPMSSFISPGWGNSNGTTFNKNNAIQFEIQATAAVTGTGSFNITISDLKLNQ